MRDTKLAVELACKALTGKVARCRCNKRVEPRSMVTCASWLQTCILLGTLLSCSYSTASCTHTLFSSKSKLPSCLSRGIEIEEITLLRNSNSTLPEFQTSNWMSSPKIHLELWTKRSVLKFQFIFRETYLQGHHP
jgi:hypothetical protein